MLAAVPLAVGLVAGAAQPAAAAPAPLKYVALGDSYSAGQGGGGPYDSCNRSDFGYPVLISELPSINLQTIPIPACQGATTASVLGQLPARADWTTRLVTLTVGGNNLGFSRLGVCATDPVECAKLLTITPTEAADLFSALVETYWAVKAKYPLARVVVLTYPRLFVPGYRTQVLPATFSAAVNASGAVLNEIVVAAAQVSPVTLVDVRDEFKDHAIGSAVPWISFSTDPIASLHPNAVGYRSGYFQALVNDGVIPPR